MSMIGKTLAHYEITNQLGRGGMGEVYQAKDRKLGRDVAIKVLPEEFARDTDRVARFQREAKLLASLNHPNIAAIHGLEEAEGTTFLVLELVEGQTLADRIKAGPIPVEESLKLALQIAEAVEAAHEKGVIHRDLKPSNIKVTPEGKVKVLDFGLAKAFAGEQADLNLSNSPTLSNAATQQGLILGTAAYMSPEQARGGAVDKRADIWAFGVVLFEMLTGRGMFEGRTVSDTLAAVLMREPEWKRLPLNLHPRIRLLLERCLEKEAKNRYGGIGDARVDIQKALADPSGVFVQPIAGAEPRARLRTIMPWIAAAIVLGAIIAGVAVWNMKPTPSPEPRQVVRFEYELPEGQQFADFGDPVLAVSPDGKQLVYSTLKGLYLRSINEFTAKLIAGTEGNPHLPFFSPDGKWIGYFSGDKLKVIPVNGGAPVALCDVSPFWGASWGSDNSILYGTAGSIMRIPDKGGTPTSIIKGKAGILQFPQILPNGKSVLFEMYEANKIMVQSLESGEPKELLAGANPRYLPTGHIVYAEENNLFAVRFDQNKLEMTGGRVSLVEGVYLSDFCLQYTVSDSGTLAYIPGVTGKSVAARTLVWVDRNGKEEPLGAQPDAYRTPKISPDGTKVALTVGMGRNSNIWIWDLFRKTLSRLTYDKGEDSSPIWSPDGKRIVFASQREGARGIYWKAADGTGKIDKLSTGFHFFAGDISWSGDGKALVFMEVFNDSLSFIGIAQMLMEGDRASKPLLREKYVQANPQISPDGRWIAYMSEESGKNEIYVRPFPEVNSGKWPVSTSGGIEPRWSRDGRELFYRNGDAMMAVTVETKPTFKAGVPKELFRGTYFSTLGIHWDISPDGKRFLMIKESAGKTPAAAGPRKINIVLNWLEELKQRVPIK
jgi:Tol biopolymer transport system component